MQGGLSNETSPFAANFAALHNLCQNCGNCCDLYL